MTSKRTTLAEAAALVPDGAVLGVGGVIDQMAPMALLVELVRRRARGLHCVTVAAGISIDLLVAAECVDELSCAIVTFEDLGTSKVFRRRVESGALDFHEHSELTIITRLSAAASGVPFLPTRGALGTDVPSASPEGLRPMECPFTGAPLLACAAMAPDVAVVHVDAADEEGNAQLASKHIWHDVVIAQAARRVIVTAERIVSGEEVRRNPERTILPAFVVDAVVEAPRGAWPTSCRGSYGADHELLRRWLDASADDDSLRSAVDRWVESGTPA